MYINKGQIQNELTKMEESFSFLHSIIYDNRKDGFTSIPKDEQITIFDMISDVRRYQCTLNRYLDYYDKSTDHNE